MKWGLEFTGRQVGAIGITYPISTTVEADSSEEARLKAYDTHEHITGGAAGIRVTRLCSDCRTPMKRIPASPEGCEWWRYECNCLDDPLDVNGCGCDGRHVEREDFHADSQRIRPLAVGEHF